MADDGGARAAERGYYSPARPPAPPGPPPLATVVVALVGSAQLVAR